MLISSEKDLNIEMASLLKSQIQEHTQTFVSRIILNNTETTDNIVSLLNILTAEFGLLCTIRKFTVLNTNVMKENVKRILGNTTLRAYYLELFHSVRHELCMNYSSKDCEFIFDAIYSSVSLPPCILDSGPRNELNHLNPDDINFKEFCGQVFIKDKSVRNFLDFNPWYYMVILVNMHAQVLLEQLLSLKLVGTKTTN